MSLLDLIEEGNLGLIHAVGKFDPERGFRTPSDRSMLELVPDERTPDPAIEVQESDLMGKLEAMIDELPEKQQEILARRFGLKGYDMSTLEEVGRAVGLTRERVRQIQMEALNRLRQRLEDQGLSAEGLFA